MNAQILLMLAFSQSPEISTAAPAPETEPAATTIPQEVREYFDRSYAVHAARLAKAEANVTNLELKVKNSESTTKIRRKAELRYAEKVLAEIRSDRHPKTPIPDRLKAGDIGYFETFNKVFILDNSTLLAYIATDKRTRHNLAVVGIGTRSIKLDRINNSESGQVWNYGGYVRVLPEDVKARLIEEFPTQAKDLLVAVEPIKSGDVEIHWSQYLAEKAEAKNIAEQAEK